MSLLKGFHKPTFFFSRKNKLAYYMFYKELSKYEWVILYEPFILFLKLGMVFSLQVTFGHYRAT